MADIPSDAITIGASAGGGGGGGLRACVVPEWTHLVAVAETWQVSALAEEGDAEKNAKGAKIVRTFSDPGEQAQFTAFYNDTLPEERVIVGDRIQVDAAYLNGVDSRIYIVTAVQDEAVISGNPCKAQITMEWHPDIDATVTTSARALIV